MPISFPYSFIRAGLIAAPLWLAACQSVPKFLTAPVVPPPMAAQPHVVPVEAEPTAPATQPAIHFIANTNGPVAAILVYADKIRPMTGQELAAEIARLGDPNESPMTQMQLAMALAQTRAPGDLGRAAALMQRIAANPSAQAEPLQPLARMLGARYLDQRRVEEDRDRQAQQLRESQRRIDQLNDRIEALRTIERSFARPAGTPPPNPPPPSGGKHQP